ncbi:MAG: hypothetical protein ACYSW8_21790 [Planctomycetota bacterium]
MVVCDTGCGARESVPITSPLQGLNDFVDQLIAQGWGMASYQDDNTPYLCCPTCFKEVPDIMMY